MDVIYFRLHFTNRVCELGAFVAMTLLRLFYLFAILQIENIVVVVTFFTRNRVIMYDIFIHILLLESNNSFFTVALCTVYLSYNTEKWFSLCYFFLRPYSCLFSCPLCAYEIEYDGWGKIWWKIAYSWNIFFCSMEYFSYALAYRWAIIRHKFANNTQNGCKHNKQCQWCGGM